MVSDLAPPCVSCAERPYRRGLLQPSGRRLPFRGRFLLLWFSRLSDSRCGLVAKEPWVPVATSLSPKSLYHSFTWILSICLLWGGRGGRYYRRFRRLPSRLGATRGQPLGNACRRGRNMRRSWSAWASPASNTAQVSAWQQAGADVSIFPLPH